MTPRKPFYVLFQTSRAPGPMDQTKRSPGPGNGARERAGYAMLRQRARVTFAWDSGLHRADGMAPFFARSVNVHFSLDDFVVSISSVHPIGSHAYGARSDYELQSQIYRPMRVFHSYRDILIGELNAIPVPTLETPQWARPQAMTALKAALEQRVVETVGAVKRQLVQALQLEESAQKSPIGYRIVYDPCSAEEWARGANR